MTALTAGPPEAAEPVLVRSPDGVEIACWRTGSGPPLVLVHGTGEDHRRWRTVGAHLAGHCTVHAVDRRGRGASGDCGPHSLAAETADLVAVVNRLGGTPVLVGHSYGAICALEAAVQVPELGGLALFEPPVPVASTPDTSRLSSRIQAFVEAGREDDALCLFLSDVIGIPRHQVDLLRQVPGFHDRAQLARTLGREIDATRGYELRPDRLRNVRAPALLIVGEQSPRDIHDAALALHAALPNSRVEVLAGQSHQGIDTGTAGFVHAVERFLCAQRERRWA
jgi:pimeloyl-ACP methyl ester carboxylesterase